MLSFIKIFYSAILALYFVTLNSLFGQKIQLEVVDSFSIQLNKENHSFAHAFRNGLVFYDRNQADAYLYRYSTQSLEKYPLFIQQKTTSKKQNAHAVIYSRKHTIHYLTYFEQGNAFVFAHKSKYFWHDLTTRRNKVLAPRYTWAHCSYNDSVLKLWDWAYQKLYTYTISSKGKIIYRKKYPFSLPIPPKALITTWYPSHYFHALNDSMMGMTYPFVPAVFLYNLNQQCWVNVVTIPLAQIQNDSLSPFGLTWYYRNPYKNFSFHTYRRFQYWELKPFKKDLVHYFQEIHCPITQQNVYSLVEDGIFPETPYRFILYDAYLNPIFISEEQKHRTIILPDGMLGRLYYDEMKQRFILLRHKITII